jgi:putative transposase
VIFLPRVRRRRSENHLYHITCRSISEIDLFPTPEDKEYYLALLQRYIRKNLCKIYAYCLMDNHMHIFLDTQGFDISKFMLSLNTAYVVYYNRKYNRHGHLFQGRFVSTVVESGASSRRLCAYIHNNPKDIDGFEGREEYYPYSSFGIYCGHCLDEFDILTQNTILGLFDHDIHKARQKQRDYVIMMKNTPSEAVVEEQETEATRNEYRNEKQSVLRYEKVEELVSMIASSEEKPFYIRLRAKYIRSCSSIRSFVVYVLRTLCDQTYSQICKFIGNISLSGVSRLVSSGFDLVCRSEKYQAIFYDLISGNQSILTEKN